MTATGQEYSTALTIRRSSEDVIGSRTAHLAVSRKVSMFSQAPISRLGDRKPRKVCWSTDSCGVDYSSGAQSTGQGNEDIELRNVHLHLTRIGRAEDPDHRIGRHSLRTTCCTWLEQPGDGEVRRTRLAQHALEGQTQSHYKKLSLPDLVR